MYGRQWLCNMTQWCHIRGPRFYSRVGKMVCDVSSGLTVMQGHHVISFIAYHSWMASFYYSCLTRDAPKCMLVYILSLKGFGLVWNVCWYQSQTSSALCWRLLWTLFWGFFLLEDSKRRWDEDRTDGGDKRPVVTLRHSFSIYA